MDEADFSEISREMEEAMRMAEAARRATEQQEPRDTCRNCDETLPGERRTAGFCDVDCREDWERREAARRRNGETAH